MRNVPFEDSLVGLGDVVDEVLGKFVVLGALLGALASSKDLAEGNSDGTPPGPLVGRLVSVAVGAPLGARLWMVSSRDTKTIHLVLSKEESLLLVRGKEFFLFEELWARPAQHCLR